MTSNVRGVYRKYLVRSPHPMMICILYLQKLVKTVVFVCGRLPYKEVMDAPRMCTISKRDVNHLAKSQRKRLLPQLPCGEFRVRSTPNFQVALFRYDLDTTSGCGYTTSDQHKNLPSALESHMINLLPAKQVVTLLQVGSC